MPVSYADEETKPLAFSGLEFTSNESFEFNTFAGKVIYLDFWASWCTPCRQSLPLLEKLYRRYRDQGFEIIAVNVDENKTEAKNFLLKHPISYVNLYDPKGLIGKKFNVKLLPMSFIIDRNGTIIHRHLGFDSKYAKKLNLLIANEILAPAK